MRRLILGFAAVAPLAAVALAIAHHWVIGVAIVVLSHALILYPTLVPNCQWLGPVITSFETDRKEVWLTIDDGPADDTEAIVEMLARLGAAATFFVIGRPDVAAIVAHRHSVANHSATHPSATFWCLGPRRIAAEIDGGWGAPASSPAGQAASRRPASETLAGQPPGRRRAQFRAPVGMKNPFVHPALAKRGMRLIGWSVRGFDAFGDDVERVVRRIVARVRPGSIVVLHQGRPASLRRIERVVEELQRRGYALVVPDDGRLKTKR
jgi:peptidoglycan/xylan/chitin deacetylase (PgdA/CDA1 family)